MNEELYPIILELLPKLTWQQFKKDEIKAIHKGFYLYLTNEGVIEVRNDNGLLLTFTNRASIPLFEIEYRRICEQTIRELTESLK